MVVCVEMQKYCPYIPINSLLHQRPYSVKKIQSLFMPIHLPDMMKIRRFIALVFHQWEVNISLTPSLEASDLIWFILAENSQSCDVRFSLLNFLLILIKAVQYYFLLMMILLIAVVWILKSWPQLSKILLESVTFQDIKNCKVIKLNIYRVLKKSKAGSSSFYQDLVN